MSSPTLVIGERLHPRGARIASARPGRWRGRWAILLSGAAHLAAVAGLMLFASEPVLPEPPPEIVAELIVGEAARANPAWIAPPPLVEAGISVDSLVAAAVSSAPLEAAVSAAPPETSAAVPPDAALSPPPPASLAIQPTPDAAERVGSPVEAAAVGAPSITPAIADATPAAASAPSVASPTVIVTAEPALEEIGSATPASSVTSGDALAPSVYTGTPASVAAVASAVAAASEAATPVPLAAPAVPASVLPAAATPVIAAALPAPAPAPEEAAPPAVSPPIDNAPPIAVAALTPAVLAPAIALDLRAEIGRAMEGLACARVSARLDSGAVILAGHVASEADRSRLRARLAGLPGIERLDESALSVVGEPHCALLAFLGRSDLARSTKQRFDAAAIGAPAQAAVRRLAGGTVLQLDLGAPDYPAFVHVSYFGGDGSVAHLLPVSGTDHRTRPGESLKLGGPGGRGRRATIGPPYGLDVVLAVASAEPLFSTPRPVVERAADYLAALAAALEARRSGGRTMELEYAYYLLLTEPPR